LNRNPRSRPKLTPAALGCGPLCVGSQAAEIMTYNSPGTRHSWTRHPYAAAAGVEIDLGLRQYVLSPGQEDISKMLFGSTAPALGGRAKLAFGDQSTANHEPPTIILVSRRD
jgi:hypothetical protein